MFAILRWEALLRRGYNCLGCIFKIRRSSQMPSEIPLQYIAVDFHCQTSFDSTKGESKRHTKVKWSNFKTPDHCWKTFGLFIHTYICNCVDGGVDGAATLHALSFSTHIQTYICTYIHTHCSCVCMLDLLPMFLSIQCVPAESLLSQPLRHPRHHWIALAIHWLAFNKS